MKNFINRYSVFFLVLGFGFIAFIVWSYDAHFEHYEFLTDLAMAGAGTCLLMTSLASEPKDSYDSVHRFGGVMFGTLFVIIGLVELFSHF